MEEPKPRRRTFPVLVVLAVVIVGTVANVYILRRYAYPTTVPDGFVHVPGDMGFVTWAPESEMNEVEPDTLYAVVNGHIVGRFQFESPDYRLLRSSALSDVQHRPWIFLDHENGSYTVNVYPESAASTSTTPTSTLMDTNGNGIPDRKEEWSDGPRGKVYQLAAPPVWRPYEAGSEPNDN